MGAAKKAHKTTFRKLLHIVLFIYLSSSSSRCGRWRLERLCSQFRSSECDTTIIDHLQDKGNQKCQADIAFYLVPTISNFLSQYLAAQLRPKLGRSWFSLMFHRFHAHFISNAFSLGSTCSRWILLLTIRIVASSSSMYSHSGRDAFDAEFLASLPPAMSTYHFIADTNFWSDDDGRNDTALWNTVYQLAEFQIMADMERMIGKGMQFIYWNSFLFACSVSRRCFLRYAAYSCGFLIFLKYPDLTPKMYPKIVYFLLKMYPKGIFA